MGRLCEVHHAPIYAGFCFVGAIGCKNLKGDKTVLSTTSVRNLQQGDGQLSPFMERPCPGEATSSAGEAKLRDVSQNTTY